MVVLGAAQEITLLGLVLETHRLHLHLKAIMVAWGIVLLPEAVVGHLLLGKLHQIQVKRGLEEAEPHLLFLAHQ
jgi:hypothetical protein